MVKSRVAKELTLADFKAESLRGRAGFFRVGQTHAGQWWWIDPEGRPFFMRGVAAVNRHGRAGVPGQVPGAYAQDVWRRWGPDTLGFAEEAARRLRAWGANALGPWADDALEDPGLARAVAVSFRGAEVPVIHERGVHLPDVFDPGWRAVCEARAAEVAAAWAGRVDLLGYYTDEGLAWGGAACAGMQDDSDRPGRSGPENGRPRLSLLQVCLSLEPRYTAYHAAWEFVSAAHAGELSAVGRDWGMELHHREQIRQLTGEERAVETAGFRRAAERFSREFAARYFTSTADALRRHDPDHLVLGCRFNGSAVDEAVWSECAYPRVDVVSWQAGAGRMSCEAGDGPVLLVGVGLDHERWRLREPARRGPTRVERLVRETRAALEAACSEPCCVGYEWARWADGDGEESPFSAGLVQVDGRDAVVNAEVFAQINARAEQVRRKRGRGLSRNK